MTVALTILGFWFAVCIICAPKLIPLLARRFKKHDDWVKQAERARWRPSVSGQVRVIRRWR
jgi:hypothetical protein